MDPQKVRKSMFLKSFLGVSFFKAFFLEKNLLFYVIFWLFCMSRQKPDSTWIRVFCCIFCVPRKQVMVMQPVLKKWSKSGPKSSKIDAFWGTCQLPLLGRGPNSSFFASWLSKSGLGSFFFGSWSFLGNFWGPNMASTSALKWL